MKTLPPGVRNPGTSTHPQLPLTNIAKHRRWFSRFPLALAFAGLVGTARADLLVNGGFTNNDNPWYLYLVTGTSATLQNTNGTARINISNGGTYKAAVQFRQDLFADLIAGTPYTLSFTATADASKGVDAVFYDASGAIIAANYNTTVGTSPTAVSFTFTPTANETGADLNLRLGGNTTGIAFDKVSLVADPRLTWAPPTLVSPTTIQPGATGYVPTLASGKDYIIKLPSTTRTRKVAIIGGRNVVLVGGTIDNQDGGAAIDIQDGDAGRIVHVEGVLITNSTGYQADAIDVECPTTIVQIENVRTEKLVGTYSTLHADVLQTFGGSKEVRIDRLTGESDYQGFFLPGNSTNNKFTFKNVNLIMDPPLNSTAKGGYAFWLDLGQKDGSAPVPTQLYNFYVQPRAGRTLASSVAPDQGSGDPQSSWPAEADGYLTWPNLSYVTGGIYDGLPPDGTDFVPASAVGVSYVSPGYLPQ